MINTSSQHLLMIEPSNNISSEPLIDGLTQRMAAALNKAALQHAGKLPGGPFASARGWHTAASGADSDNICWEIKFLDGTTVETNSLAVHYLAYSRAEIPAEELAKLERLPFDFAEPTPEQLFPGRAPKAAQAPVFRGELDATVLPPLEIAAPVARAEVMIVRTGAHDAVAEEALAAAGIVESCDTLGRTKDEAMQLVPFLVIVAGEGADWNAVWPMISLAIGAGKPFVAIGEESILKTRPLRMQVVGPAPNGPRQVARLRAFAEKFAPAPAEPQEAPMPIVTLATGLRVANFSSAAPAPRRWTPPVFRVDPVAAGRRAGEFHQATGGSLSHDPLNSLLGPPLKSVEYAPDGATSSMTNGVPMGSGASARLCEASAAASLAVNYIGSVGNWLQTWRQDGATWCRLYCEAFRDGFRRAVGEADRDPPAGRAPHRIEPPSTGDMAAALARRHLDGDQAVHVGRLGLVRQAIDAEER